MPNWKKVIVSGSNAVLSSIINDSTVAATNITGSFTGSFGGDGTNLDLSSNTSISTTPFPFAGDAQISGSLIISQSYTAGDTDSTALRLFGSGSVSESGIFEVEGSAGPLFSVADGLDGILMEVNNISGLPLFQVSSSNEVFVNRGNLTSGVTTATASFSHFTGSFQGDGTNLNLASNTTIPSTDPFPFTGDAQITGSLTISGSFHAFTLDSDNIVLGSGSGLVMQEGADSNVLIGTNVGTSLTTGDFNILIGNDVGGTLDTESNNIMIGKSTGRNSDGGDNNVYIGVEAGRYGSGADYNVAVGYHSLRGGTNNTGIFNTAIGYRAGSTIDNGSYNSFMGYDAGRNVDTGNKNILLGYNSGYDIEGGEFNITIGENSGRSIVDGSDNISIGNAITFPSDVSKQLIIGSGSSATISASLDTGHVILSGSTGGLELIGSGSTVFEVIGSEGTLFTIDDDLDGVIFTANNRTGNPVLQASASGEVYIGKAPQSLYTTAVISSNNANVTQSIYGLDTSSYGGAFFEYTAHSGSNARAGSIMAVWNPSEENLDVDMSFNETTTLDIGNTENLVMKVHVSQSQAQLAAFSTTAGYNIKTIIKSI